MKKGYMSSLLGLGTRIRFTVIAAAFVTLFLRGAAVTSAPVPARVRLENSVQIAVPKIEVTCFDLSPDNETVVVVGGKPRGPDEQDRPFIEVPPAGALVNTKTKLVKPFTNGHKRWIGGATFSRDGSALATISMVDADPFLRIWDAKSGKIP